MRRRSVLAATVLGWIVAGCGLVQTGRPVPPGCQFPEGVRISFAGDTTMAELGIPHPGEERGRYYAWITADPITMGGSAPARWACVEIDRRTFEMSVYPGSLHSRPTPAPDT
jgi:hypothetical protein